MPFSLSTLISARPNLFPSPSPTDPTRLYFAPGGHVHDRHTISPDQLHVSLSDPVLVAAEEQLSNVQRRSKLSIINESTHPGSIAFHLKRGILSNRSDDDTDSVFSANRPGRLWRAEFHGNATENPSSPDLSSDSCDIVEVMTITSIINVSPDHASSHLTENRHIPYLAPLASETFREELYIRGYLKRPATIAPRKPRTDLMSMSRKVFPKVLGRRQGREVAETLRTEQIDVDGARGPPTVGRVQNTVETPARSGPHPQHYTLGIDSVILQAPHADTLESPAARTDTATSASDSFDLHEFSYLTAFTTPPSSPSVVLDAETSKQAVTFHDGKHAV